MSKRFDALIERGAKFLNCTYPIMGGAMSWVSEANLVSAISNAGGFGVLAAGAMTPELLAAEIAKTQNKTKQSFGVNLISMHPQLDELVAVCEKAKVKYVVIAGGLPKANTIEKIKLFAKVLCFAPTLKIAQKLVKIGVDALIIEGMEAGGHIGPVSTSVLAQEIVPHIKEVPVFVAGGIGRGEMMASYLELGAAGCQLGTRFVCAEESIAHPNFKQAFIRASARDAVATIQLDDEFPVIPVRALVNEGTRDFGKVQKGVIAAYRAGELDKSAAQLKIEHYWAGALRRAVIEGDVERGSLMAGQSVGMVECEQKVSEIIDELVVQAKDYLERRK